VFSFSVQLLSETFLILRRNERDIIKNVYWSSCKVPDNLDRFSNNIQIQNFMKIRRVGVELFRTERRTDITKLIVAFRNFVNSPNKTTLKLSDLYRVSQEERTILRESVP
jgi:hypothetical protein